MTKTLTPKIGIASTDWSRSVTDSVGHPVPGGAGWIRLQQIRPYISFRSVTGNLIFHDKFGFGITDFDGKVHFDCSIIVMQRLMFGDLINKMKDVLSRPVRPYIINDIDDWYWGLDKANAAYELTRPENNPEENINHYREILRLSDAITVSTPFLYEKMSQWLPHKNVIQIENCVTTSDFYVRRMNLKAPIVGWVGSTSHRSRDLEVLDGVLDPSLRYHHSGHLHGAPLFSDATGLPAKKVTVSPMYAPKEYAKKAFCFDIGLAPLNNIPFNDAKSWIKLIEYAAAGIPAVASPSPEYVRLYEQYGIGRIAFTPDEWREHIDELRNPNVRNKEAKKNLNIVKNELDVKVMAKNWNTFLESLF